MIPSWLRSRIGLSIEEPSAHLRDNFGQKKSADFEQFRVDDTSIHQGDGQQYLQGHRIIRRITYAYLVSPEKLKPFVTAWPRGKFHIS